MKYIKGTKAECEAYNSEVTQGENYKGNTAQWAEVKKIGDYFYIKKHPKYPTNLNTVNSLPDSPSIENPL